MKAPNLKTKHSSDRLTMAYLAAMDIELRMATEEAKARFLKLKAKLPGYDVIKLTLKALEEHASGRDDVTHLHSVGKENRTTFMKSNPKSWSFGRVAGEELHQAGGIAAMRVVLMVIKTPDSRDQTWLATCWNGLDPEWRFEEVDTRAYAELPAGELH